MTRTTARRDVLGLAWAIAAGIAPLVPSLVRGGAVFNPVTGDHMMEFIPWTTLAWNQVHHGHLPLWNPYSALGMPLVFNWQSGAFGLPALVGYLVPVHFAFTAGIITTVVVGCTGVYVLCRMLGAGALGCTTAATIFVLSGPFMGWLGWPVTSVLSWLGWLFAAALFVVRGRRPLAGICWLAGVVALATYAGQPDAMALLFLGFGVFVLFLAVLRRRTTREAIVRPLLRVAVGTGAGLALAAPLVLPGLQLLNHSVRGGRGGSSALPAHALIGLLIPGFDGAQLSGSTYFGVPGWPFMQIAFYVGSIGIMLAVVGAVLRRRIETTTIALVAVAALAVSFVEPVDFVLVKVVNGVRWNRAIFVAAFAIAVLAGLGADALVRAGTLRRTREVMAGAIGFCSLTIAVLWAFGRGNLGRIHAMIRSRSFLWPALVTCGAILVVAVLFAAARRRPGRWHSSSGAMAASVLLALETMFLVHAGAPLWAPGPGDVQAQTAAVLKRTIGHSVLGLGVGGVHCTPYSIAVLQNVNVQYELQEFDVYDPLTPRSYFESFEESTGTSGGTKSGLAFFCPAITSAKIARLYGVEYVIEPAGGRGFDGAQFVRNIGPEPLYRVPGAAPATISPLAGGRLPAVDAPGAPVAVTHPSPRSWRMVVDARAPQALRLRLTKVPGWHATIDGRPLALTAFSKIMLQAKVPAGHHVVELRYWPPAFTAGIGLAGVTVVALAGAAVGLRWSRRRR